MMSRFITLIFSLFAVVSADVICPANKDCVINCNSTDSCANQTIQCPTSDSSEGYICMISCTERHLCSSVTIEAGSGVSTLIFESLGTNASPDVVIFANGTWNVEVVCNGANACEKIQLNVVKAKSVKVSANGTMQNVLTSGISEAIWNINDTEIVEMNFLAFESCYNCSWNLHRNTNVTLLCSDSSACILNEILIVQSSNVLIQAMSQLSESAMEGKISLEKVKSLIVKSSDDAFQRQSFSLIDIEYFLLDIDGTGSALSSSWNVRNVTHIALNNWNATSFWLVNGTDIQSEYQCPNDKDCNIRIDVSIETTAQIDITCPMKTETVNPSGPTCSFYCTAYYGCNSVNLSAVQTPNLQLFFNPSLSNGFSLNVDGSGLSGNETIVNITCNSPSSCSGNKFVITGYENVSVLCNDYSACNYGKFNFSNFGNANFVSYPYGMVQSLVSLSSGSNVFVSSLFFVLGQNAFESSHWSFTDIDRVLIICGQGYDCQMATFDSTRVGKTSVVCGNNILRTQQSCFRTIFNNYEDTSFNLTCAYDNSCNGVYITYDGDKKYDSSCVVSCELGLLSGGSNCEGMEIFVRNNQLGFDAVTLICEDYDVGDTCQNIIIGCGNPNSSCFCSVEYNETYGMWDCEGTCGTAICDAEHKKNNETLLTIFIFVIVVVAWVLAVIFFFYCCCYRRCYPRPIQKEDRRQLLENQSSQIGYNT